MIYPNGLWASDQSSYYLSPQGRQCGVVDRLLLVLGLRASNGPAAFFFPRFFSFRERASEDLFQGTTIFIHLNGIFVCFMFLYVLIFSTPPKTSRKIQKNAPDDESLGGGAGRSGWCACHRWARNGPNPVRGDRLDHSETKNRVKYRDHLLKSWCIIAVWFRVIITRRCRTFFSCRIDGHFFDLGPEAFQVRVGPDASSFGRAFWRRQHHARSATQRQQKRSMFWLVEALAQSHQVVRFGAALPHQVKTTAPFGEALGIVLV